MPTPFTGAVLTGGASSRMGVDKALLDLGGRPMATYALAALREAGAGEVLAVGGDGTTLEALGFRCVSEAGPGRGPLAGIVTALETMEALEGGLVVVVACDLPLVTAAAIIELLRHVGAGPGAVASVDGHLLPVLGAYRRTLLAPLAEALEGDGAVHRAIAGLGLVTVALDAAQVGPNVNTAADARQAAEALRRRSTSPAGDAG